MNKEEWLIKRTKGIGGSDCACILGLNPYKSNVDLWEEKTGLKKKTNISNPATIYGTKAESHLISLFALDYPNYEVKHEDFDIMTSDEKEYIQGSFDGRLLDLETNKKGVLEIKTCTVRNRSMLAKWQGNKIPDNYFCQILHYMIVNPEFEFARLRVLLRFEAWADVPYRAEIKDYNILRKEVQKDIDYLKEKEIDFWENYVIPQKKPNLIINFD